LIAAQPARVAPVPNATACLIDVYDTLVSADFGPIRRSMADAVGVDVAALDTAIRPWRPLLSDGRATLAEALEAALRVLGQASDAERIAELVALDRLLLAKAVVLHQDSVPFLDSLRARGVRTAIVSNCRENTREMLEGLGLSDLVDELVLSCEVGAVKPAPEIFTVALDRLGATAADTVFVDDRQECCDGAAVLGIRAVRIDRTGGDGGEPGLAGLESLF
jgi:putative hydrolase of the HAD superfamily